MEGVEFRQHLIRIQIINWLVSLFIKSPELFTHRDMMDELAEWLWSDVCWLEGCDNLMMGYRSDAFYCCKAHFQKEYSKTPERIVYYKLLRQLPENKEYHKKYSRTPEARANQKDHRQTPKVKAYQKAYQKAYYLRKKAERITPGS